MLYNIILSLVFTIFVELLISIFFGINKKKDFLYITLVNIITNPITEFINLLVRDSIFHYQIILIIEVLVIYIEYLFYKRLLKSENINFLYLAILNNVCSYVIGLIFNFGVKK